MAEVYRRRGRWKLGGSTSYLCGLLPLGTEDREIICDRLSGSSAYCAMAEGKFHVKTIFLVGSSGARGEGSFALT